MTYLPTLSIRRRTLLVGAVAACAAPSVARAQSGRIAFQVFRNGHAIGRHEMTISGAPGDWTAKADVDMAVKFGPVPVFSYEHHAVERWSGGRFVSLETSTRTNGHAQSVRARREAGGVRVVTERGEQVFGAETVPLTHWNPQALRQPLFNPQTGKLLRVSARDTGVAKWPDGDGKGQRWEIRGDAHIDDWYEDGLRWSALSARLPDGARLEYRLV